MRVWASPLAQKRLRGFTFLWRDLHLRATVEYVQGARPMLVAFVIAFVVGVVGIAATILGSRMMDKENELPNIDRPM